ncbi:MAG TPA: isoprenylcysteine carboxylmethyltransferase family protein [Rhizomicrobium sp.]
MTGDMHFRGTKLYDVLAATPMVLLYGLGIGEKLIPDMFADLARLPSLGAWLDIARDASAIVYFTVIVALVFLRCVPVGRSIGMLPRLAALAGAYVSLARPKLLPFAHLPWLLGVVAVTLTVLGTIASIIVLIRLGRAFSILPEARRLVTDGPYRIVRHPLYVAEEVGNIGIMLQYLQPWSLLIEIAAVALQLWRISFEERVLRDTFPEYAAYAQRTRRLIPGIY